MGIKGEHNQMGKEDKPVTEQENLIFDLKEKIQDQAEEISSLKNSLQEQSQHMDNKETYIRNLEYELNRIKNNTIWKAVQILYSFFFSTTANSLVSFIDKIKNFLRKIKILEPLGILPGGWVKKNSSNQGKVDDIQSKIKGFSHTPKFSLILPVYNPEREDLKYTLDSILNQYYPHWELCIVDDASTEEYVLEVLEEYKKKDQRIFVKYLQTRGGMSEAYNEALSSATGEFAGIMNDCIELSPDGLYEAAKHFNLSLQTDLIYSDEDKLNSFRKRIQPVFRPKWSAKRFLTHQFLGPFFVCRKTLIEDVGGFRKEFDGCQDYDLLLRITRRTNAVTHIPKILYHSRITQELTASQAEHQQQSFERARLALQNEMKNRGWNVLVKDGRRKGTFKIKLIE